MGEARKSFNNCASWTGFQRSRGLQLDDDRLVDDRIGTKIASLLSAEPHGQRIFATRLHSFLPEGDCHCLLIDALQETVS